MHLYPAEQFASVEQFVSEVPPPHAMSAKSATTWATMTEKRRRRDGMATSP
jgi:hypothetical protein